MKMKMNWIKRLFTKTPKESEEREGWRHYHIYNNYGDLVLMRKYGTMNSDNWEACLIATAEDMERAKRQKESKSLLVLELSRDDFNR